MGLLCNALQSKRTYIYEKRCNILSVSGTDHHHAIEMAQIVLTSSHSSLPFPGQRKAIFVIPKTISKVGKPHLMCQEQKKMKFYKMGGVS